MFGHPNSRPRVWRVCFHKKTKKWACDLSLQQLADLVLLPRDAKLPLDFECYFMERNDCPNIQYEENLTRCASEVVLLLCLIEVPG